MIADILMAIVVLAIVIALAVAFHEKNVSKKALLQEDSWKNPELRRNENMRIVVRTEDEIDRILERAGDGFGERTAYPNASYEEGICAFAAWLFGDVDFEPFDF